MKPITNYSFFSCALIMSWLKIVAICSVLVLHINAKISLDIKKYGMCDDIQDTPIQVQTNYTKYNDTIYFLSAKASAPVDMGENVTMHAMIQMYENDEWNTVLKFDEKDPCKLLNDYGGEMWSGMAKDLNIPQDKCPIPKGIYEIKNYTLDFNKMPVDTIPKGLIRILANATQGDELLLCWHSEFNSF